MKHTIHFITLILTIFFAACGPSDEDRARAKMNYAKSLLEEQDTALALQQLDSIALLFPNAKYTANAAKNLVGEINYELLKIKQVELDSVLAQISRFELLFDKQKTEFDRFTQYVHKKQSFQGSLIRSFLQVHLDERGDLYLSSNYHGKGSINHYGLRVYDMDISAKTDSVPVGDADNHQSDFMEYKWERVSYRNGKDNGVIDFIASNSERKLKAVFLGKGQNYIILEEFDKTAIKDAFSFSKALKRKQILEKEIMDLKKRLNIE